LLNKNEYKEKRKKLFSWSTEELRLIREKYPHVQGVNGQGVIERKKHIQEFNKRLSALKKIAEEKF